MGSRSSEARFAEGVLVAQTVWVTGVVLESVVMVGDRGMFLRQVSAGETPKTPVSGHEVATAPCKWIMEA